MTRARTAPTAVALTATLGLAAAAWVVAVRQMNGMDMGVATHLGSFAFFVALWVSMMAAMMLPGAAPAVLRRAHASGRVRAVPLFIGSYVAIWALVGVAVYAVYRPHGTFAASSASSHCCLPRVRISAASSGTRRSRWRTRSAFRTKRASSASSGRPASSQKRAN